MPLPHRDAICRQSGGARTLSTRSTVGTLPALMTGLTRRIGLQQELFAVARQHR
ncbi:Uncharacterised protein [Mycobacteroides abscessus subsp. abscessus]|nr:Uncharacterised protein [Mycobacteroides abscessus subsp. abscessus]